MEVHSSGNHTHVTSSADRLAIESKSTNLSEHLTVEQPVSKRKRKRRRKRRKKPVPLSSPILTEEHSSQKPLKLDDNAPPDPQQQTKRDTLKEDADAVPIYHTSGRSLSGKLVSTTGSGKASDRLRSTSGGKPSDHLISTEKTASGDLKTTGKKAISDRVRMTGTGSMAAKVMMEEKMDSSLEESAKTGFSSEKSRSKRYRFKGVRSPEMLGWEEDAPQQEKNAPFASVSALSAGSKAAERRRQIQKRVISQNRQKFVPTGTASAPMEHRWNNPQSVPAWQRIVLQKQMEQRRQLQAAAAQSALNDSQSALLPFEQALHQQLVDAQTRKVSGQSLLKDAVQKKRADGVSFTSGNYGQSLHQSGASGIQTDTNTVHDSVHSASLAERVLLFDNARQTGSEKQQNTTNSKGWHNHSQNEGSSKEHTGSPTQSDRQAGTGRNHGWRGKAATLFALRTAKDAERRMQQSAQQEQDETARQVAQFKQSTARNARASVQAAKSGTQIGRSGWKLTQKAEKKAQRAGV